MKITTSILRLRSKILVDAKVVKADLYIELFSAWNSVMIYAD
ncbi:MAG: hypothetical protein K0S30_1778 [Clostridia bacterium]|jgi:hypothetical protein|nr:hypothetical protein [Clostridia bacterium]